MALPDRDGPVQPSTARPFVAEIASRQGLVVAICVAALCALAWWWLWRMSAAAPMPEMAGMAGMDMQPVPSGWSSGHFTATFAMWAIMMVAMMLPSAAPMILLEDVFTRRNGLGPAATLAFAATYLALWTAFALVAACAQLALVASGVVAEASLAVGDRSLAALLLAVTGIYELTPLKRLCLSHCQSPVGFLTRHWRTGVGGAVRMGLQHGSYCVGCCGFLMLLLFVGGIMNLAWIALLTVIVLAEKYAPPRLRADRIIAVALLGGAAFVALG